MKKNIYSLKYLGILIKVIMYSIFLALLNSCGLEEGTGPPPPPSTDGALPKIISVDPPDSALAGITVLTITGQNFSPIIEENLVTFDGLDYRNDPKTQILEATSTELKVRVPLLVKDSVKIKISILGPNQSPEFDPTYIIHLKPANVEIFGDEDNVPSGITTDISGNLYFNQVAFKVNQGLKRFTTSGMVEDFAGTSGSFYIDLKYGSDGRVFGTRSPTVRAIFANAEGGNPSAIAVSNSSAKLISLDFDNNYNIWTGGIGGDIYRITPDGSDKLAFPFEPEIKSIRFFDGFLYLAAKMDSTQAVYKIEVIDSENLGTPEVYFDVSSNLSGLTVNAITFANDGRMFLGTDAELDDPNVMIVVNTDGSFNTWYPGVVTGPIVAFAWGTGDFLYYIREFVNASNVQKIMRINMVTEGAPYYGRD